MLNESSVNIVRVVTLFINDKPRVVTAAMRIGGVGDFTDNVEHKDGSGMFVVGIDNNGKLKRYGYHSNGSKEIATPGGIAFDGFEVFNFDEMKTSLYVNIKDSLKFVLLDEISPLIARGMGLLWNTIQKAQVFCTINIQTVLCLEIAQMNCLTGYLYIDSQNITSEVYV